MRTIGALVVGTLILGTPLGASAAATGTFTYEGKTLKVVDAFAYEGKAEFGDETAVRVRLFGQPIDRKAVEGVLDFAHALEGQTRGAYVEMEFSKAGEWSGSTYDLGGTVACGWCSDGKAGRKSQMKVAGGAIRGTLRVRPADYMDNEGPVVDLTLDLPVATVTGTTALAAGGGDPGKAFVACRAAFKKKVKADVKGLCFAADDPNIAQTENVTDEGFWMIAAMGRDSLSMEPLKVVGGRTRGGWAELLVEGKGEYGPKKGRVYLRQTPTGWRVDHEHLADVD